MFTKLSKAIQEWRKAFSVAPMLVFHEETLSNFDKTATVASIVYKLGVASWFFATFQLGMEITTLSSQRMLNGRILKTIQDIQKPRKVKLLLPKVKSRQLSGLLSAVGGLLAVSYWEETLR